MKNKNFKLVVKILLVIFLTLLMCENYVEHYLGNQTAGRITHAVIGYMTVALIVLHLISNISFFKSLKKNITPYKISLIIVNCLLFIAILGLMVSGMLIMIEKVFKVASLNGIPTVLHSVFTYWLYFVLGFHIGLNIKVSKNLEGYILSGLSLGYGIFAFIILQYYRVMFVTTRQYPLVYSMPSLGVIPGILLQLLLLPGILLIGYGVTTIIRMSLIKKNNIEQKENNIEEKEED